jgi:hypothetical protein
MEQIFLSFAEAVSPALQVLLEAVLIALAATLTAWAKAKYGETRASMGHEQQYFLDLITRTAVTAAEQLYTDNAEKREYAIRVVTESLAGYGIKLDLLTIAAAIEAEVFAKNQRVRG